jgi:hypothetical protein
VELSSRTLVSPDTRIRLQTDADRVCAVGQPLCARLLVGCRPGVSRDEVERRLSSIAGPAHRNRVKRTALRAQLQTMLGRDGGVHLLAVCMGGHQRRRCQMHEH